MDDYIQKLISRAGELATECAMNGNPSKILWIPPQSGTSNYYGSFVTVQYPPRSASEGDPWVTKGI